MTHIELFPIGREILTGRVLDRNSRWIAQRLTAMGGHVTRIVTLNDDVGAIGAELQAAATRGAQIVITTGGLGPTFDDVTLEALARGAGIALAVDVQALGFVEERYRTFHEKGQVPFAKMTPERNKMARLPARSHWLPNPEGAAPGAQFTFGRTEVFALPGPPREMQPMFTKSVEPWIATRFEKRAFAQRTLQTDGTDESVLTGLCRELTEAHANLHAKTNPTFFGDDHGLTITLSVWDASQKDCDRILDQAHRRLAAKLIAKGVSLLDDPSG